MSKNGKLKVVPTVFGMVIKDGKVLLLRRANTNWLDGWYDLPAGHLEDQEKLKDGAIRELTEETGLTAKPEDLRLVHIYQNHHNPNEPHYGHVFLVKKWSGQPRIMEPHKSDDLGFFDINNLPEKLAPYSRAAIEKANEVSVSFSFFEPDSMTH